jgi:hypothetical protein
MAEPAPVERRAPRTDAVGALPADAFDATESGERAYEPFGPALTTRGIGFGPETTALLIRFDEGPEEPERVLAFLKDSAGYVSHITMRELGDSKAMVCFAHFDNGANADAAAAAVTGNEQFRDRPPAIETYAA